MGLTALELGQERMHAAYATNEDNQTYCCAVLDSSQRRAYGTGNRGGSVLHLNKSNEVLVPVFKQEI